LDENPQKTVFRVLRVLRVLRELTLVSLKP